jgi:hypothetical protein
MVSVSLSERLTGHPEVRGNVAKVFAFRAAVVTEKPQPPKLLMYVYICVYMCIDICECM